MTYTDLGDSNEFEKQDECFDKSYDKLVNGGWE
jgi:hypothetical protein